MKVKIYKVDEPILAEASGMLFWRKIRVGKRYFNLPEYQQKAVLVHEFGHHHYWHIEKKLLALIFCPFLFYNISKKQELQADKFAAERGEARGLYDMFKDDWHGGKMHPSHAERRKQLEKYV